MELSAPPSGCYFAAALLVITGLISAQSPSPAPAPQTPRPAFPTRAPHTSGYVSATELPDGAVPSPIADGNFIIGPTHPPAPETTAPDLTNGSVVEFTMNSTDSKY